MFEGAIILAQRHDYILKKTIMLIKDMIILAQKHNYYVKKYDYSCSKTRLLY